MILSGKEAASALRAELKERIALLAAQPTLAVLRVGEDPSAAGYLAGVRRAAEEVGVAARLVTLPPDCTKEDLFGALRKLNEDKSVHGILTMKPLPPHLKPLQDALFAAIAPDKDVDGLTPVSAAATFCGGDAGFRPCTAEACMRMIDYYKIDCTGKRAVVLGRSTVIGKPAAMLLLQRNATVTVCHTKTVDVPAVCREAELVVAAVGEKELVRGDWLKPGAIVLDVGTNWDEEAGKLVGDVCFQEAEPVCAAISPVPGGVGTVTSTVLLEHVVRAAERAQS